MRFSSVEFNWLSKSSIEIHKKFKNLYSNLENAAKYVFVRNITDNLLKIKIRKERKFWILLFHKINQTDFEILDFHEISSKYHTDYSCHYQWHIDSVRHFLIILTLSELLFYLAVFQLDDNNELFFLSWYIIEDMYHLFSSKFKQQLQ